MTPKTPDVVPFGKYRGRSVETLLCDRSYALWLAGQPWFKEQYPSLAQRVHEVTRGPSHDWRDYYLKVLASPRWAELRAKVSASCGGKCQRCGVGESLELHHKHYLNLGRERDIDVELLCLACHEVADRERASISEQRAQQTRFSNGCQTYWEKRRGEGVEITPDMEEKFERWLDRKEKSSY